MSATEKPEELIASYKQAYEAANGEPLSGTATYENGWFVFRIPTGFVDGRYRRAKLQAMRTRLESRAGLYPPPSRSAVPSATR